MDLLLGLDVGTTAVKAALFDEHLNRISSANTPYVHGLTAAHEGWAEHDVEDLWRGVVAAVRAATASAAGRGRIAALSLSTQGGTTIALDEQGQPLAPAISWMDTRATNPAGMALPGAVYRTTGWWSATGLPLQHIAWLRRNRPDVLAATARVVFVADYVIGRMTGVYTADPSNAAMTMLYDVVAGDWSDDLLAAAGIVRAQVSPLAPSGAAVGRLLPEAARELGLPPGISVVNGAHDQYCAALGADVLRPGDTLIGSGTAWVLLFAAGQPLFDARQVFHPGPHVAPGLWGALSSIPSAGAAVEWYLRQMVASLVGADRYAWLNEGAARAPAGSKGLLFMPHLGGFYSAAGDRPVRGAWVGLTLAHASDELSRSIMEGVAYEVRRLAELAGEAGVHVRRATMTGGAASSPLWPQILADVLAVPVTLLGVSDAACRGAAILAGVGAGVFANVFAGAERGRSDERIVQPRPAVASIYDGIYATYRAAFDRLGDTFAALSAA